MSRHIGRTKKHVAHKPCDQNDPDDCTHAAIARSKLFGHGTWGSTMQMRFFERVKCYQRIIKKKKNIKRLSTFFQHIANTVNKLQTRCNGPKQAQKHRNEVLRYQMSRKINKHVQTHIHTGRLSEHYSRLHFPFGHHFGDWQGCFAALW